MTTNFQQYIDSRIEKLRVLKEIMNDPEMVALLRSMLANIDGASAPNAPIVRPSSQHPPRRKYSSRRGSLVEQVFAHLREFGQRTTAKHLADYMSLGGYRFRAKDPNIAVSKSLRQLSDAGRVISERGEHAKAPITYWVSGAPPEKRDQVSVQGELTQ